MRNVIVTGGSRGLGLSIATKLASTGYRAIAIARNRSDDLAKVMESAGGTRHLGDIARLADLIGEIRRSLGPIYGLVNNAALGTNGMLSTMRIDDTLCGSIRCRRSC